MSEQLAGKKRIRGGHKESATRIIQQVDDVIVAGDSESAVEIDTKRLLYLKFSLGEKLGILKKLDEEVLDFIEEETDISWEIEQADEFKERIYVATIDIDKCCEYACKLNSSTDVTGTRSSRTHAHGAQMKLLKLIIRNFIVGILLAGLRFGIRLNQLLTETLDCQKLTNLTI